MATSPKDLPRSPSTDNSVSSSDASGEQHGAAERVYRIHAVQIPALRAFGFGALTLIAALYHLGSPASSSWSNVVALAALNIAYSLASWLILRRFYGRTGPIDLALVFFHVDVLVWLATLHTMGGAPLLFALFLVARVADQVGFGFYRALYFNHVVVLTYLGYVAALSVFGSQSIDWGDHFVIVAVMYLLGTYIALIGSLIERLRKRARLAARQAAESLEQLGQQTAELVRSSAALSNARAVAEKALAARSNFIATMSHEIRTPINGIVGVIDLLMTSERTEEQRRLLLAARGSTQALQTIINDVLDLASIDAGKLTLQRTPFNLRGLVTETVDVMRIGANAKGITLEYTTFAGLPARVVGDPGRLRQVLLNLVGNAIKFTLKGGVVVTVDVLQEAATRCHVRFEVRDTGIGIARDVQARVFERFTQADESTTRRFGGSGLGLAIAKDLVQLMGGRLELTSAVGEGATFGFAVWFDIAGETPTMDSPAPKGRRAYGARILVAEDHPISQMVLRTSLMELGCLVDVVNDGAAAHRAALDGAYDLIIMDCHMPEMDGHQATRMIRADEQLQNRHRTPVVALTASALPEDQERCLASGMDQHLSKPLSREVLIAALDRWLPRKGDASPIA
jgi:signal transduction histidine kinase